MQDGPKYRVGQKLLYIDCGDLKKHYGLVKCVPPFFSKTRNKMSLYDAELFHACVISRLIIVMPCCLDVPACEWISGLERGGSERFRTTDLFTGRMEQGYERRFYKVQCSHSA